MISSLKFEYTGDVMSGQELGFYAKLIFLLMISRPSLKMGHVGSKTMSLRQINGTLCEYCGSRIFNISMFKPFNNRCLHDI